MAITAQRFIDCAWALDLRIVSAESSLLDSDFIMTVIGLGICVRYIYFSCYGSPEKALMNNTGFVKAIKDSTQPRLL